MNDKRLLLDDVYGMARFDRRDQHHATAARPTSRVRAASEIWTTEAVLIEVGNFFGATYRDEAASFIKFCDGTPNFQIVPVTTKLLLGAVSLLSSAAR